MTGSGLTTDPSSPTDVATARAPRRVVIRARTGWMMPDLVEVWHYRELFWVLAERDIKVRYKQTTLGVAWAVVQPLFTMAVFTAISRFGAIPTDGARPELFYFCGMLPWMLITTAVSSAGNSLVANQHVISKVYFPRLVIPAAAVVTALVDFGVAFIVLLGMMLIYRTSPPPQMVLLPAFVALAFFTALGCGLWLGALTTQFRDVRHVTPFLMQAWLFCTPVLYPSSAVHGGWKAALLGMNPASAAVEGVRWCLLGRPAPGPALALSAATTLVVLGTSLLYFRRVERTLADSL